MGTATVTAAGGSTLSVVASEMMGLILSGILPLDEMSFGEVQFVIDHGKVTKCRVVPSWQHRGYNYMFGGHNETS